MNSRREVVQACVLSAGAPFALAGPASAAGAAREPAIYRAIFDERFKAGQAFAAQAAARGWTVSAIRGDVTDLWFKDLSLRWRHGPAAITGVTLPSSLFCLDMLARDVGMRLTARADHPANHLDPELVSWLIAPRTSRSQVLGGWA
jgi:hypothetical protein